MEYVPLKHFQELQSKVEVLLEKLAKNELESNYTLFDSNSVVEVNVGGTVFSTFVSTLTKHPSSMLAAMFSGRHPIVTDKAGRPFLDRNPEMFKYILEYLRTDIYPTELLEESLKPYFECEIDYFNIERPPTNVPFDRLAIEREIQVEEAERMLILCFDVYEDVLLVGCRDGAVQMWSIREGNKTGVLNGHTAGVTDIRFVPVRTGGRTLAVSCSSDSSIRVWDLWQQTSNRVIETTSAINSIDFIFNNMDSFPLIVAAGKDLSVFNMKSGEAISHWRPADGSGTSFSCVKADGGQIFAAVGSKVKVYNIAEGFLYELEGSSSIQYISVTAVNVLVSYADCTLGIWNRANLMCERTLQGYASIIARFNVIGSFAFCGCYDGALLVFNLRTGKRVRKVHSAHSAVVRGIKWTNNSLFTIGADAKIILWRMTDEGASIVEKKEGREAAFAAKKNSSVDNMLMSPRVRSALHLSHANK